MICGAILSQENNIHEFIGALKLNDTSFITYKINFRLSKENKIEGYSTTDFYGSQKTKTKIKGELSSNKKEISFYETENIFTISKAPEEDFCFINVKKALFKKSFGQTVIEGKFDGKLGNDSDCASGTLHLASTGFLKNEKIKDSLKTDNTKESLHSLIKKTEQINLMSNDVLNINWSSNKISLEIFDAANVDDDKVSIYVDDKILLQEYSALQKKKIINFQFEKEKCVLKVVAVNEGVQPPNTVSINLLDSLTYIPLITKLNKGQATFFVLRKNKQNR